MSYTVPNILYKSIKINNKDIALSGSCKASFVAPFNKIDITLNSQNCSLSQYKVMVTKVNEDYDIDLGTQAYRATNIPGSTDYSFSININSTNFKYGSATYRISLYAQSAIDYSWDVTYLFMVLTAPGASTYDKYVPSGSDGLETVVVTEPSN